MPRVHRSTVTSEGQITLPEAVRERLGVVDGTQLEFVLEGATVTVRNPDSTEDQADVWFGVAKLPEDQTPEAWLRELRGREDDVGRLPNPPEQRILYLLPGGTLSPKRP